MTKNDELAPLAKSLAHILQGIQNSVALSNETKLQKVAQRGDVTGVVTELKKVQEDVKYYAPLSMDEASWRRCEAERREMQILEAIQTV